MNILEDILDALGVEGDKAQGIIADLTQLAESRAGRALVVQLPREAREKLDDELDANGPDGQLDVIRSVIGTNFDEETQRDAFEKALGEVLEEEFVPTIAESATEEQLAKIQTIIDGG